MNLATSTFFRMSSSLFKLSNSSFCPVCGSVLPLVNSGPVLTCLVCSFNIKVKELESIEKYSVYECADAHKDTLTDQVEVESIVDRVCIKCGNTRMSYHTQQTRSADEGQTVFYKCISCGHQDIEAS